MGYTRSRCCYGNPGLNCFGGGFSEERCCAPRSVATGPEAFLGYLAEGDELLVDFLKRVVSLEAQKSTLAPTFAAAHLNQLLRTAVQHLSRTRNQTLQNLHEFPLMAPAFYFVLEYFVTFEALRRRLSRKARVLLVQKEKALWLGFTAIYQAAFGYTDFCRCMEATEFYSHLAHMVRAAEMRKASFAGHMINGSRPQQTPLHGHSCSYSEAVFDMTPQATLSAVFTSQCLPGDIAMQLIKIQNCILEQDITKVLVLQQSVLQLASYTADCLDEDFWGFSLRDLAVEQAKLVWKLAKREAGSRSLGRLFQAQLAWSPGRGVESDLQRPPWHTQCGPHHISGPVRLHAPPSFLPKPGAPPVLGPVCTEIGRFWLHLGLQQLQTLGASRPQQQQQQPQQQPQQHHQPQQQQQPQSLQQQHQQQQQKQQHTLAIIPITYAWNSNIWHHMHWWIPALLYLKGVLKLSADEVDIALVFPHEEAHWGISATAQWNVDSPGRTEPEDWSLLQHRWPRRADVSADEAARPWKPEGIHADVLRWLTVRPAAPLEEFYGSSYERLVLGLPSMRFQTNTPALSCSQISSVRTWVSATAGIEPPPRRAATRVTLLQRGKTVGRVIENWEEVLDLMRSEFSELQVQVLQHSDLAAGISWTEQFRLFSHTDILVGAHGAGLAWLWAQRSGSATIEFRSRGSPFFYHRCGDRWNADVTETFGGLAWLSGVHHICIRPHGHVPTLDVHDRDEDITIHLPKLKEVLHEAQALLDEPLPCSSWHSWVM
ncbi:unnamed protein product [Polarella glacialis]|uniref:Glycosyltransferase 61 catalytic domain-containing protein n=1 Tax=Polarella glacialis TaxID=89957 RepID=A0A813K9R4_POLGL|nr:unnamed protein product [Polarella glacialis]CAE8694600.1 unnamed protein product [Polarella glacialis]